MQATNSLKVQDLPESPIRLLPRWKVGEHYEVDIGKGWQYMVTDTRTGVEYYVDRANDEQMRRSPIEYETIKRKRGYTQGHVAAVRMLNPHGPRQTEICDVVAAVVSYMNEEE